ncbi:MAG: F0F1 ATP synthase subunit B [Acidobacteriota bacterium]|nr:MAG: F0F1 ATP synthase subunit B [Acidobacteriota bacterium]
MATLTKLALILASAPAAAEAEGNPLTRPIPGLWFYTLVIFGLLLLVLYRYGWGVLISKLDARDNAIRGAIDEARREREQAGKLLAEQEELLADTRRKTADMLTEAQQEAKLERQRILDQAREENDKILARGREQIEQETRAAIAQIRASAADLAVEVTRRMLPQVLDPGQHRALAEKFVSEIERTE